MIQRNDELQFMFYQNINLFLMWFIQQKLLPNKSMQNLSAPGGNPRKGCKINFDKRHVFEDIKFIDFANNINKITAKPDVT